MRAVTNLPHNGSSSWAGARAQRPYQRLYQRDVLPVWLPACHVSPTAMVGEMVHPRRDPPTHDLHHANGQPRAATRNKATNASPQEVAHDPPITQDTPQLRAGQETLVSRGVLSAQQATYGVAYNALRRVLREGVQAGPGADEGIDSLQCRFAGALYALLMAHPIDRHGRCRRCRRRPGSVIGRRRQSCVVYVEVNHWLYQSDERLRTQAAHQWGLTPSAPHVVTLPRRDRGRSPRPWPTDSRHPVDNS
jgi:hypothetical protein